MTFYYKNRSLYFEKWKLLQDYEDIQIDDIISEYNIMMHYLKKNESDIILGNELPISFIELSSDEYSLNIGNSEGFDDIIVDSECVQSFNNALKDRMVLFDKLISDYN